jgi:type IV pilus assembly protein PilA
MSDGKSKAPGWVWIVVIVSVVVAALGILSALALFGVRKYMASAKQAEARAALVSWASGLTSCAQREGRLPGTSQPVPASLSDVQGKKWQSTPADWSEPAFSCAGFNMSGPQYFQYRWQLRGPDEGAASAVADLDGDGVPEKMLSVGVVCNAGACTAGSLSGADDAGRAYPENTSEAGKNPAPNPLFIAFVVVAVLGMLFGSIWMTVAGFQVSVGWGLVTLLVPCGRLVFLMQHWQVAKRPFIWQIGCVAALLLGGALYGGLEALLAPLPGDAPAVAPSVAPLPPSTPAALPPVVVPPLVGGAVDLSTVMGRARKLADAWQPEAALLGVEATLVDGKIQAQDGASAKVTFGPSAFGTAQARSGLFVVVYDKTGINGGPVAGTPGKTLPEPMCAPERVLTRLTFAAEGPTTLRYGLDGAQRPMWLANSQAHPKDQSLFDPQDCSPAGIVGRKQR